MVKGKLSAPKTKSTHSRGTSSCQSKFAGKEFAFKEAICKVCDRVFKTDELFIFVQNAMKNQKMED